ncbi:pilus assembly PilX N-terminal domain-containing protein [Planctobacterium marinum]
MIRYHSSNCCKQKGAAILISVIMLLLLALMVTIYTGKIKLFEMRIARNDVNHLASFAAAEAGLMKAMGTLTEDPTWDGTAFNETLDGSATFTVSGTTESVTRDTSEFTVMTITSIGASADGLGQTTVVEQVMIFSVLANPPDAPLIVKGGINVGGNFEVVANPNGGGTGVPLSIWTDQDVDMDNGSGTTCGQQEYSDGDCSSDPYSEKGFQDLDILDNDANFPSDMFEYMFNVPEASWESLRDDADEQYEDCDSLGASTTGLIWVEGSCGLNAGTVVGSTDDPVILVVTDGDLSMNGGATIYGLVFSFRKPDTLLDFELDMNGGASVFGAVASNHSVGHANGTFNVVYDSDVLSQLEQGDAFQRLARIPGSWRDF